MDPERRREQRTETNVHLSARMPARPSHAIVHDLSHDGCRIELGHANIEIGGTALLDFPGAPRYPGTVVWVRGNQAGIQFARRLAGPPAVALGLDAPEPEPVAHEADTPPAGEQVGLLRHWIRRLTGKFS